MEKSLISKYLADRCLRATGVTKADGYYLTSKTWSSAIYVADSGPAIFVTADTAQRDLLYGFDLVQDEHVTPETWQFPFGGVGVVIPGLENGLEVGQNYLLPLFVLDVARVSPILPGDTCYGQLRTQCAQAMRIWRDREVSDKLEWGLLMRSFAAEYWPMVLRTKRLALLHDLAAFCCENGPEFSMPNLNVKYFGYDERGKLIPYTPLLSLATYGILEKKVLYTERTEQ